MGRNDNILARKRQILVNKNNHVFLFTFGSFHRLVILSFRSEHERHCPDCSFVRGDHTKNVPMSGGLSPSKLSGNSHKFMLRDSVRCIGNPQI